MPIRFRVEDHLIVPFACPKWEIDDIRITGVSTEATFFEADSPVAYLNRARAEPLQIQDVCRVWPMDDWSHLETDDWWEALKNIRNTIIEFGNLQTDAERTFAEAYFAHLGDTIVRMDLPTPPDFAPRSDPAYMVFSALLPLPQAHLYVLDPLTDPHVKGYPVPPKHMFKVDFAFWTGERFVAVEIDGGSHIGSEKHIRKDRMLQRAGVQMIHITNSEVEQQSVQVIDRLLPDEVTDFRRWSDADKKPWNPLAVLPF